MKKQIILLSTLISLLFFSIFSDSCRKPEDLFPEIQKMTDSISFDGAFAVPLVDTEFLILNFVPEGDSSLWVSFDDEDLAHLRMYYSGLIDFQMNELYDLPYPAPQSFPIPADSLTIGTDTSKMKVYSKMLTGHLYFDDPKIKFIFYNEIPIVTFYRLDTLLMYDANNVQLSHTEDTKYTIAAPTIQGETVKDSILIDKNRIPDLPTVFSPVPKYIRFITTTGSSEIQNLPFEVDGSENFRMDAEIDLPLEARLEDLVMGDTLDFVDLDSDTYNNIDSLVLKIEFNNGYPFEAASQIYITDTTDLGEIGYYIDSLFSDTSAEDIYEDGWHFESAETDASGIVKENGAKKSMAIIRLNKERLDFLRDEHASKIVINSTLNSYDQSNGLDIRIMSYYKLGLRIGVKVDISGNTSDTK